jgi:predicted RNA polymerase sigma factor
VSSRPYLASMAKTDLAGAASEVEKSAVAGHLRSCRQVIYQGPRITRPEAVVVAARAYRQAIDLTANEAERRFLTQRLTEVTELLGIVP